MVVRGQRLVFGRVGLIVPTGSSSPCAVRPGASLSFRARREEVDPSGMVSAVLLTLRARARCGMLGVAVVLATETSRRCWWWRSCRGHRGVDRRGFGVPAQAAAMTLVSEMERER